MKSMTEVAPGVGIAGETEKWGTKSQRFTLNASILASASSPQQKLLSLRSSVNNLHVLQSHEYRFGLI